MRRPEREWNVVISIHGQGFRDACRALGRIAPVERTDFFNVIVMKVRDIPDMLETVRRWIDEEPEAVAPISRLMPVTKTFFFKDAAEFSGKAKEAVAEWIPDLAGKSFHVRIHRRGFKGTFSSPVEERALDEAILAELEKRGSAGRISFEDPDAVIVIETIYHHAGASIWTREDIRRYPFLRPD